MQFSTIYSRVESLANVTTQRALIKDAIQSGLYRATAADLPHLMSDGSIQTIAPYETGTVSVTNGSKTVTGSGTTFTSAMVGRKIRVGTNNSYYRIASYSSATSITLDIAYQEDTASGSTYVIYKDEYRLPADMDVYKVMRQIQDQKSLVDIESSAFHIFNPSPNTEGKPNITVLQGSKLDTYSTGTVSITSGSSTLTGSSTVWSSVEGLGKGSKITIGVYVYTVKSVDSDTQITIYENASITATGSAYSASLDNYILQLYPYPSRTENIYFKYQRLPFPLIDDEDIPDLPDQWHHILITAGLIWAWEVKDKEESKRQETLFANQVLEMWSRICFTSSNRSTRRWSQDDIAMQSAYSGRLGMPSGYGYPAGY